MAELLSPVVARLDMRSLDDIPLGILRICTAERITYMNRAAAALVGEHLGVGSSLAEVAMDEASRQRLHEELGLRYERGQGSCYELRLVNPATNVRRLVEISAVPEYDDAGALTGSIGFLRDRSEEVANLCLHRAIQEETSWSALLGRVAQTLHELISFHTFTVTMVSERQRHLRQLCEFPQDPGAASAIKWWPMPPHIREMTLALRTGAIDVAAMFSSSPYRELARDDEPTAKWLRRGFRYLLRRPIYHDNRLVAVAMLQRKDDVPFTRGECEIFEALPVAECVNMALTLDKGGEMRFWLDLIQAMGERADDPTALRRHLVTSLERHYAWEHVALFRLDEDNQVFRLACQSRPHLPDTYQQPFDRGSLADVRRTREPVVLGDLAQHPGKCVHCLPDARSEMCVPIPGQRLRWILDVQSRVKDAFADEELRSVELLLRVVSFMLDRAAVVELKTSILESVADAVILTSPEGMIEEANPAALRMLEATAEKLRGTRLSQLLLAPGQAGDRSFGHELVTAAKLPSTPAQLCTFKGHTVPILLSGATLSTDAGGKVYVATDITHVQRAEQMDALKRVFSQVAAEMRIPLSLACSYLREVPRDGGDPHELSERALAQLRKADLPLERILRLAGQQEDAPLPLGPVDVGEIIAAITADLPRSQAKSVIVSEPRARMLATAAYSELAFCLHSIIAFLLRQKAQADEVRVEVRTDSGALAIGLRLARPRSDENATEVPFERGNMRSFVFPEPVIEGLMARMGGAYRGPQSDRLHFELGLKLAEDRHEALATAGA
jgi:PAS domain S-box-containing protein